MTDAPARRGVVDRIVASYSGMRRETLALLAARPSEAIIFSFLAIAGLAVFSARMIELTVARSNPGLDIGVSTPEQLLGYVGASLIGAFVLLPLGAYLLSLLLTGVMRILGSDRGYYETRLAVGWSAAVAFPLILIISALNVAADAGAISDVAAFSLKIAPTALWAYFLASSLAAAHGLRSARKVLGPAAAVIIAIVGALIVAQRFGLAV